MKNLERLRGYIPEFTINDRLRKAREYAGIEQVELAEIIGVARSSISNYERGVTMPRRSTVISVSIATGVDYQWLLTGKAPADYDGGEECAIRDLNPEPTD